MKFVESKLRIWFGATFDRHVSHKDLILDRCNHENRWKIFRNINPDSWEIIYDCSYFPGQR